MSREGMRIGEAMALTVHDIDWQRGTILINKNVPAGIGRLEDSTKPEPSDREIEFWSEDFRLALEAMLKRRRGSAVDICAGGAERHSVRTPERLTVDSNTVARSPTKSPHSASRA
jgi:integrase